MEQQGEVIEAIWCYDTILKDNFIGQDPPLLQAAGRGLGLLLLREAETSRDSKRTERLLNRAVHALNLAHRSDPQDPDMAMSLAEAHGQRFRQLHQPADVFAANLLLDQITTPGVLDDRIAALRALLKSAPPTSLQRGTN